MNEQALKDPDGQLQAVRQIGLLVGMLHLTAGHLAPQKAPHYHVDAEIGFLIVK